MHILVIRSVWLDKKIIGIIGGLGSQRNQNKCFFAGRARFGFLHFYFEIFHIINSFSTYHFKVSYSEMKYILLLGRMSCEGIKVVYGTTNVGCGSTNADAGVGIGLLKGGFKNFTKKAIN